MTITRDITARKQEQDLGRLVSVRASSLDDANIALRVMLEKTEKVKTELEDKVLANIKERVFPYLEMLKKAGLSQVQRVYVDELKANLHGITSF